MASTLLHLRHKMSMIRFHEQEGCKIRLPKQDDPTLEGFHAADLGLALSNNPYDGRTHRDEKALWAAGWWDRHQNGPITKVQVVEIRSKMGTEPLPELP
jgi:hypothetical protein